MTYTINENAVDIWVRDNADTMDLSIETDASSIYLENGRTLDREVGQGTMVSNVVTVDNSMEKVVEGTLDGAYESCKMYGRSLVNLVNTTFESYNNISFLPDSNPSSIKVTSNGKFWSQLRVRPKFIKPNTHYFVAWDSLTGEFENGWVGCYIEGNNVGIDNDLGLPRIVTNNYTSGNFFIFNSRDYNLDEMTIRFHLNGTDNSVDRELSIQIDGLHILEYQEGMEDWDIPYFEGLCDVKMPILKNVGKNLLYALDGRAEHRGITLTSSNGKIIVNGTATSDTWVNLQPIFQVGTSPNIGETFLRFNNTTLTLSTNIIEGSLNGNQMSVTLWEKDGTGDCNLTMQVGNSVTRTITEPIEFKRLWVMFPEGASYNNVVFTIQLEESSSTTTYEDYKTNILETSNDVVLRGLPNGVKDSYDCLTGEYVQRVGEMVFNGNEEINLVNSVSNSTHLYFDFVKGFTGAKRNSLAVCDRFTYVRGLYGDYQNVEGITIGNAKWGSIRILASKLTTPDVNGFKQWLRENPTTVQYVLENPITTIIEPSTIPFIYENGHVILESGYEGQSLLPTLEYSTVINRTGQIQSIANTVQKQEKQITKLEQMLIQNIVDLDYNNTLLTLGLEINEVI